MSISEQDMDIVISTHALIAYIPIPRVQVLLYNIIMHTCGGFCGPIKPTSGFLPQP